MVVELVHHEASLVGKLQVANLTLWWMVILGFFILTLVFRLFLFIGIVVAFHLEYGLRLGLDLGLILSCLNLRIIFGKYIKLFI